MHSFANFAIGPQADRATRNGQLQRTETPAAKPGSRSLSKALREGLVVPEQREQQNDRQRYAQKPKQSTFSKAHDASPQIVLALVTSQRCTSLNSSSHPVGPAAVAPRPHAQTYLRPVTRPKAPRPILGTPGPDEVAGGGIPDMARTLDASSGPRRTRQAAAS